MKGVVNAGAPGLGEALDRALDALAPGSGPTTVTADGPNGRVEAEVVEVDRIGVRLTRLRVERAEPFDLGREIEELPDRFRALPERLAPVEVDPRLGGATLRTRPEEMEDGEFFEVEVRGGSLDLTRHRARAGGAREALDFALTRGQLRKVVG